MKNLEVIKYEQASPEVKEIFDGFKKKIGKVPNIYATFAHSPSALKAILGFRQNLEKGEFSSKESEAISLAVSQANDCSYCVAGHTALAKMAGFSEEETILLRKADSKDAKIKALVVLAKEMTIKRGNPDQKYIDDFFKAGYSKAALVELVGYVVANCFNNYIHHMSDAPIDFPAVKPIN